MKLSGQLDYPPNETKWVAPGGRKERMLGQVDGRNSSFILVLGQLSRPIKNVQLENYPSVPVGAFLPNCIPNLVAQLYKKGSPTN